MSAIHSYASFDRYPFVAFVDWKIALYMMNSCTSLKQQQSMWSCQVLSCASTYIPRSAILQLKAEGILTLQGMYHVLQHLEKLHSIFIFFIKNKVVMISSKTFFFPESIYLLNCHWISNERY